MTVSYDVFTSAFLAKVQEYRFLRMPEPTRRDLIDGYMYRTCAKFGEVCVYDIANGDDETRSFEFDGMTNGELHEIIDIVSDGMVYQWMSAYMYKQENLENTLTTGDYSAYSPAELTYRITNAYENCRKKFVNAMREYSYRHGDISTLHL